MKFLSILLFLTHNNGMAKAITEYECSIPTDLKVELSLIDPKLPSISLKNKDTKIARCFYQTLPSSKTADRMNVSNEAVWNLQLLKCETYNEKMKNLHSFSNMASFKQAQNKRPSYLRLFNDQAPVLCKPRT